MSQLDIKIEIQNLEKVQRRFEKLVKDYKTFDAQDAATKAMTKEAYRQVLIFIHVDTGALKSAQRMFFYNDRTGGVRTDGTIRNPKTGLSVGTYVGTEFSRGGTHDTYGMVVAYAKDQIIYQGMRALFKRMRKDEYVYG
jgi:hypothetical protein